MSNVTSQAAQAEAATAPRRILIVDDYPTIHEDYRKILCPPHFRLAGDLERELFGEPQEADDDSSVAFDVTSAHQGQQALELVEQAARAGRPFAVAFVDMRMPPGWNGLETIEQMWRVDPAIEVVICTAYSDFSWQEIVARLGHTDRLLMIRKPFQSHEVRQLALSLSTKWQALRDAEGRAES